MTDLSFRIAQPEDAPEIVRLINSALRPQPGKGGWTSEASLVSGERTNLDEVKKIINQASNVFILGLHNDTIVACVHVDGSTPEEAYLGTMAVEPSLQNSGIAKAMGAFTNEYASTKMGAHFLVTQILAPRPELISLSFKYGYQQTGRAFPYKGDQGIGTPKLDKLVMIELQRLSRNWVKRKLDILFSHNAELEQQLRDSFKETEHTITFADFTADNIGNYDLVIPLSLEALKFAGEMRHLLRDNGLPLPNSHVIGLLEDKYLLNRQLLEKGLAKHIPKMQGTIPFPYLLKKRIDENNNHIHKISNPADELQFASELADPSYFRQFLVPVQEHFAVNILFRNKKILCSRTIKYTYSTSTPVPGKDDIIHSEAAACTDLVMLRTLLNSIGFEGLCCIHYLIFDNRIFILGIKPVFDAGFADVLPQFVDMIA